MSDQGRKNAERTRASLLHMQFTSILKSRPFWLPACLVWTSRDQPLQGLDPTKLYARTRNLYLGAENKETMDHFPIKLNLIKLRKFIGTGVNG